MIKEIKEKRALWSFFKYLGIDLIIVGLSFLIFIWMKPATIDFYFPHYIKPFLFLLFIWMLVSAFFGKYRINSGQRLNDMYVILSFSNVTIIAIVTSLLFFFNRFGYSRLIVFGTIFISSFLEFIITYIYFSIVNASLIEDELISHKKKKSIKDINNSEVINNDKGSITKVELKERISNVVGSDVYSLIDRNIEDCKIILSISQEKIDVNQYSKSNYSCIIDLSKINSVYGICKFFSTINLKLPFEGTYVGRVETYHNRKQRINNRLPFPMNRIDYFVDYFFTRVIPKLLFTKGIYFFFFKNRDRVLSKAETFGRLYACGFEVMDELLVNNELFFVAQKIKTPSIVKHPSYGFLITLTRHGRNGELFKVYKIRTMHAYAEYLQEYIFNKNKLQEGGKFKNDFRITLAGRIFRKFWIDEIPMLINLFAGDMKLVGVRPLSPHYFNLYSEELRKKRIKYRPGLIPPFYADIPKTFDEIMMSESKYLDAYEKAPFLTDWNYFWKAFYNIFVKKVRGK